jgi:hypothetical protein
MPCYAPPRSRSTLSPRRRPSLLAGPLACVAVCLVGPSRRRFPLAPRPAPPAQVRAKLRVGTSRGRTVGRTGRTAAAHVSPPRQVVAGVAVPPLPNRLVVALAAPRRQPVPRPQFGGNASKGPVFPHFDSVLRPVQPSIRVLSRINKPKQGFTPQPRFSPTEVGRGVGGQLTWSEASPGWSVAPLSSW